MSLIRKPHELQTTKCIKMLIYGQPGIGKSTLALSAPSPLHLDFDGGVHRVRAEHLAPTVQIESWENVIDLMEKEDLSPFKTLVIDTAGKMLDYMSAYIIAKDSKMGRKDGQLALQGFGARKGMFQRFLAQAGMLGKHLVFVAHEKEEKDGDQKVIRPEIGGSSGSDLIKDLDLVGYVEAKGKTRTISFDPCEKFYGKNTCGLEAIISLRDLDKEKNDMLVSVFDKFASNLQARTVMMGTYSTLMDSIRAKIELVADADSANDFITWAQTAPHLWDSSMQARFLITAKAKALGLAYNAAAKAYTAPKEVAHAA
jgi:hypothetical protein